MASPSKSIKFSENQDYELIENIEADGGVPVSYYVNKVTGLKIFLAYVERPMVRGDLAFATETHDDDGLPHTLEHLVFMGSEKYPYKGVLDLLANRSFASGTNAYTDRDHTSYSLSTAGSEGFLNLLPIYMDHLFFPTLTDQAYITEIHHINGRGEDAGVVYCEMQSRENSGDDRCHQEMERGMYPGKCGYKSNTGGLVANIRTSLNNDKIKDYHAKYYVPKNFCMVITGPIKPEELFKAIKPIEDKLYERFSKLPEMEKPWSSDVPPLEESFTRTIQYPCDENEDGIVYLGYRGPTSEDFEECVAITLLTEYLNQPSISPFQREFVECEEPFCSSIDVGMVENRISYFYFTFESVVLDLIPKVADKVHEILKKMVSGEEDFDTERMNLIISRRKVGLLLNCERNPHNIILSASLSHFLYGQSTMKDKFQLNRILDKFCSVDKYYWLGLITKFMIGSDSRFVCINGEPSKKLLETMTKEEAKRIEEQKKSLGENLAKKEQSLLDAKSYNERPVPPEVLYEVAVPSVDNVKFFSIETETPEDTQLPIMLRYDMIQTNFVSVFLVMDTSHNFKAEDRLYIPLLEQLLFESPILRNGELIPHQTIVRELFADTVSMDVTTGVSGTLSNIFSMNLQVEVKNYVKAINWIKDVLFNTQFPAERIKTIAGRMIGDITQMKRDGDQVVAATSNSLLFKLNSNNAAENFVRQQIFLKDLMKRLKANPKTVEQEVTRIRDLLINEPKNLYAHVSLNAKHFRGKGEILKPWYNFLSQQQDSNKGDRNDRRFQQSAIVQNYDLIKLQEGDVSGLAVANGSVESNYLHQIVPSIKNPHHDDLAAILVLIQYFTQLEGPLYRELRGGGLSYHYYIRLNPNSGLLYFGIEMSTQLVEAFKKTLETVMSQLDGTLAYEEHLLQSAKSSLICEFIAREKNPASKSMQSLRGYLLNIGTDYDRQMLSKISKVELDDLRRVGPEHLSPLFRGVTRSVAVCCHPGKLDYVMKGLNELGCNLKAASLDSIIAQ